MPAAPTPPGAIQLGSLQLLVVPYRDLSSDWTDLALILSNLFPKDEESSRPVLDTLTWLIKDEALQFGGAVKVDGPLATIRVHLVPSDWNGSRWKETQLKKGEVRKRHLKRLFACLGSGWGEAGEALVRKTKEDGMRMHELYNTVPSPSEPNFTWSTGAADDEVFRRLMENEEPEGVKTRLYRYQFMETDPDKLVDQSFTRFEEAGRPGSYYVKYDGNMDIQRQPGWYDLPKGGVLCEQMGVGKTLMCLTLILATLHQPCLPAPEQYDTTKVITNVRLRDYPFEADRTLRRIVGQDEPYNYARPSLQELCIDALISTDASISHFPRLPETVKPFLDRHGLYFSYTLQDDSCRRRVKQLPLDRPPDIKKVYLANTTLIVVPKMLVDQWVHEVEKHVEKGALRMIVVRKEMPDVKELMKYDAVLMSVERFGQERRVDMDEQTELLRARWKRIILDEGHVAGTSASNAMRLAISMSIERRWAVTGTPTKHLQQGGESELSLPSRHASPAMSDPTGKRSADAWSNHNLNDVARFGVIVGGFLSAQPFKSDVGFQEAVTAYLRKATGPTFGAVRRLRGLMNALMVKHQPRVIDAESSLPPSTREITTLSFHPMQRLTYNVLASLVTANVYECSDDDISHFLHPRNTRALNAVVANLKLACFWYSAHEIGAMSALRNIVAYLDPLKTGERLQVHTHGLNGAAENVGDEDVDMAGQSDNVKVEEEEDVKPDLDLLTRNVESRAPNPGAEEARRLIREDDKTVDTRPDSYFLECDDEQQYDDPLLPLDAKVKLKEACRHLRRALNTPGWNEWMNNSVSLPFEASPDQFSARIRDAWSDSMNDCPDAIDSHSLALLREANVRGATEQALHIKGWDGRAYKCSYYFEVMENVAARARLDDARRERAERRDIQVLEKEKAQGRHGSGSSAAGPATQLLKAGVKRTERKGGAAKPTGSAKASKSKGNEQGRSKARADKDELERNLDEAKVNAKRAKERSVWMSDDEDEEDDRPRPLPEVVHTTSRCPKINHIMKRMQEADISDRFVVFGEPIELGHVSEALELIDVKHTSVITSNGLDIRIKSLKEFDDDREIRVILLETKLAARGLNLTSANRMIFCAPVWSVDVLAQAIKRVHRIGQTRPTHIEILVMAGTFEEDIVNRAANLRSHGEEEMYTREMIKRPRFVEQEEIPTKTFAVPFIPEQEKAMLASQLAFVNATTASSGAEGAGRSPPMSPLSDILVTPHDMSTSTFGMPSVDFEEAGTSMGSADLAGEGGASTTGITGKGKGKGKGKSRARFADEVADEGETDGAIAYTSRSLKRTRLSSRSDAASSTSVSPAAASASASTSGTTSGELSRRELRRIGRGSPPRQPSRLRVTARTTDASIEADCRAQEAYLSDLAGWQRAAALADYSTSEDEDWDEYDEGEEGDEYRPEGSRARA